MRVLVVGSGGREHALLLGLSQSNAVDSLFCAPGNAGTAQIATNLSVEATDIAGLVNAAREQAIDLTIVGPEVPLAMGIVDRFEEAGLSIFGPNQHAAQLESSKEFTKNLLTKYKIPTARAEAYSDPSEALRVLPTFGVPVVVKADGLCAGKGVLIAHTEQEAVSAVRSILVDGQFGEEGNRILLEEYLDGYEASVFCLAVNGRLIPMPPAMDYKKIGEGDTGENTGGVGCIAPNPRLEPKVREEIYENIVPAIERALVEEGLRFTGLLFIGFLIQDGVPYVLEFNTRFGDPETEALLPLLASDLGVVFQKAMDDTLQADDLTWKEGVAMGVVLTSEGYPGPYRKGTPLPALDTVSEEILVYHNGTAEKDGRLVTAGGRVLTLVTVQETLEECRRVLYDEIDSMQLHHLCYRSDIGKSL